MSLDFTVEKYTDLCETIAFSAYTPLTVRAYLEARDLPPKVIVMRHDVDTSPRNEPMIALIESDFGISASYYFRYKGRVFRPDVIARIAAMGHEIGYHYETLDRAKGDPEKAIEIFKDELAAFREVADVRTISMHGNPLTRWDNRDVWRNRDFRDFGLVGEAYLSFSDVVYLSDTGRNWSPAYKVKDILPPDAKGEPRNMTSSEVYSTEDVIELIETGKHNRLYLLTHGARWGTSTSGWVVSLFQDTAVNIVKRVLALRARAAAKTE